MNNDGPLSVNVKVGYKFHDYKTCTHCQHIFITPKVRKRLLYKSSVGCRPFRVLNDKWIVSFRVKPRRVIKLKRR